METRLWQNSSRTSSSIGFTRLASSVVTASSATRLIRRGSIRRSPIRFIHVRHEEAGGFAAGADASLTGELTACAGSAGPGGLHFINGLYEAQRNGSPVVLIASQVVRNEIGTDFPQEVDFSGNLRLVDRSSEEIRTPEQAERLTVLAAQAALSKRGVAVLIVPADVAGEHVAEQGFQVHRSFPVTRPSDFELQRIADTINRGERITIYGGAGCEFAHDQVIALAERLQAPPPPPPPPRWSNTSRAKDFLTYDNPFSVGMTGMLGSRSGYEAVLHCDTLLLLGCGFAWSQFYPEKANIIQIDIDGRFLGRRHPIEVGAVGDVGPTIEALLPLLAERQDDSFVQSMLRKKDKAYAKWEKPAHDPHVGKPMHPQFMIETIASHADADAIWTADDGSSVAFGLRHIVSTGKNRVLCSLHTERWRQGLQRHRCQMRLSRSPGHRHTRRWRAGDADGRASSPPCRRSFRSSSPSSTIAPRLRRASNSAPRACSPPLYRPGKPRLLQGRRSMSAIGAGGSSMARTWTKPSRNGSPSRVLRCSMSSPDDMSL